MIKDIWEEMWKTLIRYLILVAAATLAQLGYWWNSLTEPVIGVALAVFTILWYYFTKVRPEVKKKKEKRKEPTENMIEEEA